jgi:hypothetical protein
MEIDVENQPVEIKEKRHSGGAGLLLAGLILLFVGLGIQFDFMPAALFFGVGLGLIAMAWWRSRVVK